MSRYSVDETGTLLFTEEGLRPSAVDQQPSPNRGGPFTKPPPFMLMHFTAGRSRETTVEHFKNPKARASSHLVIGRDGSVTQCVPFTRVAWHAGVSTWTVYSPPTTDIPLPPTIYDGLNHHSLGIELSNAGPLERALDGTYRTYWGQKIPPSDVIVATHKNETRERGWHRFPRVQLETTLEILEALFHAYENLKDLLGHDDVAPKRKIDPGPAFPLERFRARFVGRRTEVDPVAPEPAA
jgi:N-acetylmuramoyl-L-alanine amidase